MSARGIKINQVPHDLDLRGCDMSHVQDTSFSASATQPVLRNGDCSCYRRHHDYLLNSKSHYKYH